MYSFYKTMLDVMKIISALMIFGATIFLITMMLSGFAGCSKSESGQIAATVSITFVMFVVITSALAKIASEL